MLHYKFTAYCSSQAFAHLNATLLANSSIGTNSHFAEHVAGIASRRAEKREKMRLYADEQREIAACEATGPAVEHGVDGVRVGRRQREHARGDLGHLPVPLPPVALHAEEVPRRERRGADAVHVGADPATAAVEVDGHGRSTLRPRRRTGRARRRPPRRHADDARGRVGVQRRRRRGCGRHRRGGFTVADGCVGEAFPDCVDVSVGSYLFM